MTSRGRGHLPDPPGHQAKSSRILLGSPLLLQTPASASVEALAPPVLNQGGTSACTGFASACGIAIAHPDLDGIPDPLVTYKLARCIDRMPGPDGHFPPLFDGGARPNQVMRALTEWGIVQVRSVGVPDESTVNNEPNLAELEGANTCLLAGEYRIDMSAPDYVAQFRAAIASGKAVCFATWVDTVFENWVPGQGPLGAPNRHDPIGGGHYLCAIGYTTAFDGKTLLRFRNSWGEGWGLDGDGIGNEDFMAQLSDVYVMSVRQIT